MQPNSSASTRPRERTARKQSAAHKPPSQRTEHLSHPSRSPQKRYFREWRANPLQRVAFFPSLSLESQHEPWEGATREAPALWEHRGCPSQHSARWFHLCIPTVQDVRAPPAPPQTHTSSPRLAMGNAQPRRVPQPTQRVPQPKDGSRGWGALQSPGEQQHQPSAKRRRGGCSQGPSLLLPNKVKHR